MIEGNSYSSSQLLIVGNGQRLEISHTSNIFLYTSLGTSLNLKNVLCVPKITKNLISISKLLLDNNLIIEFSSNLCFIKDNMEGTLVAQGITKDGLYQLLSQDDSFDHSKVQSSKPSSMLSFFSNKELVNSSQESDFLSTCTQLVSFLTSGKMSPNLLHNRFGLPKKQVLQTIIKHLPLHNISSQNFDFCDACQLILKPDHHLSCCILIYGV